MNKYTVTVELLKAVASGLSSNPSTADTLEGMIDALPDEERVYVRNYVSVALGPNAQLPRNLYYNYQTQTWIK